jgi:hypothetical protein
MESLGFGAADPLAAAERQINDTGVVVWLANTKAALIVAERDTRQAWLAGVLRVQTADLTFAREACGREGARDSRGLGRCARSG